ncbi:DUF2195 family protein [Brucella cytisi]|uniref:DUF2195 family protein n=1 Tax=Brucella cytisi TaxID=407152 RepID=UPI0035E24E7B
MHKLIFGVTLSALLCGAAAANDAGGIAFENKLRACVAIKAAKTVVEANVVSARTQFQLNKSIGTCGCFSARATYTSSVDIEGGRDILQQGVIVIRQDDTKILVLASDASLVGNRKVHVQLACAGPT